MALDKQIQILSVDTACFYNDQENEIQKKLLRMHGLKSKISKKPESELHSSQISRCNRIIAKIKKDLEAEFNLSRGSSNVRELRFDSIYYTDKDTGEIRVKNKKIISVFDSFLTRTIGCKINELTFDLISVNIFFLQVAESIIKNGFMFNGEKYMFHTSSAGQIRTKRAVFIKESVYAKYQNTLTCGLSVEKINSMGGVNTNKYMAYLALTSSATDEWKNFDIDRAIVVDDLETAVTGEVDFIDEKTYTVERKVMDIPIEHTDGCGMMLNEKTRMVRLPWVKGLMCQFPFDKFVLEKCGADCVVTDIYGKEYHIIADKIEYIFTKSQFKLAKYYDSWNSYKDNFKKYKCKAAFCNEEQDYIKPSPVSYQMMQSLSDMTREEVTLLAKNNIDTIYKSDRDFKTMCQLLGANSANKNYMQKTIEIYPEIMRDDYNKQILRSVKKKLVKDARSGKLRVGGKYTFAFPDMYAFCEYLFLGEKNPNGLLANGEVSCNLYNNDEEFDILRSPSLYFEHPVRKNKTNSETSKWFVSNGCHTSTHDLISKILQFDNDGDTLLLVNNPLWVSIAKRNMVGIVPLFYNMKKAEPQIVTNESLYNGLTMAFKSGKIGIYSNDITKIWNSGTVNRLVLQLLCAESNFSIDSAKTLYMPKRPKNIHKLISSYTQKKVPNFFMYAKDKTKDAVEPWCETTVNLISAIIPKSRLSIPKHIGKIQTSILLKDKNIDITDKSAPIIEFYNATDRTKIFNYNNTSEYVKDALELPMYKQIRDEFLKIDNDLDFVVDTLVKYLYDYKKATAKMTLWACFGEEIFRNVQNNLPKGKIVCQECGKRFTPKQYNQVCCDKCLGYIPIVTKKMVCVDCGKVFEVDGLCNNKTRCDDCQQKANYTAIGTKMMTCVDCGKEFEVDARNMTKKRCNDCQSIKYKLDTKNRVQKYRNNNGM